MINLSYRYDQDSSSLELLGMPDVSSGDSEQTIGILSSWSLKIIGSPLLEGEKEHLENLMQVILQYSSSYILGIRKTFTSNKKIVTISPNGITHKLLLKSTKKDVNPLEIFLDDSELSDLTRCLDRLRYDSRLNINWNIYQDKPISKKYLLNSISNSNKTSNFIYALIIFLFSSTILILIPINKDIDLLENNINSKAFIKQE